MRGSTKRAQMQMGEVVIVMIIFFFLIGFGIIFFSSFLADSARSEASQINRLNLAETAKILSSLPELHCSLGGDEDLTCIDLYKAIALSEKMTAPTSERLHYANLFPGYRAELQCVYPSPCTSIGVDNYELFDYLPADSATANTDLIILPVTIQNPATGKHGYGLLKITQVTS